MIAGLSDNMRGILAMLVSALAFVINDALVKLATSELPTGEIIVIRGAISTVVIAIATTIAGAWASPSTLFAPPMLIRLIGSAFASLSIVAALRDLPLATTSAILQLSPLAVTAGAALLLGAKVGWRRWTASVVGLLGAMLIIKPGTESFAPEMWIALSALLFVVVRDLTTRFIDHSVPSLFVALASSFVIMLSGLTLLPFETWVMPSSRAMWLLLAAGSSVYVAYYFGIVAMRTGEIAAVSPFRYTLVVMALILSYLIWGHVPDRLALLGIAVVTGAGIYMQHRERIAARALSASAAAATTNPTPRTAT